MSVENFDIHKAMRSYGELQTKTLGLLAKGEGYGRAFLKKEKGIDDRLQHYFEQLRSVEQEMIGVVRSLEGRVHPTQLLDYQTDLAKFNKQIAFLNAFFSAKKERAENRPDEGKWDNEEASAASRPSTSLPDEMQLEVFQRLSLQELSEAGRVNKGWNTLYTSTIKEELKRLAAIVYPGDAAAGQRFKENLYASFAGHPGNRDSDGIAKLSHTECLLLAFFIAKDIGGFQQEEKLSSMFPLLHRSLQNTLAMIATLGRKGAFETSLKTIAHLKTLVNQLLAVDAIPQALALVTAIPCKEAQSECLSKIALKKFHAGDPLLEVAALLRIPFPIQAYQRHTTDSIVQYLMAHHRIAEAMHLMLKFPVHIATLYRMLRCLERPGNFNLALSFARRFQQPYEKSLCLQWISAKLIEERRDEEAISLAREIPNLHMRADYLSTFVATLADRRLFKKAQELAESMETPDSKCLEQKWLALGKIVNKLAQAGHFEEAFNFAHEKISDPFSLSYALNAIIYHLLLNGPSQWDPQALRQAVAIARTIPDLDVRAEALVKIAQKNELMIAHTFLP